MGCLAAEKIKKGSNNPPKMLPTEAAKEEEERHQANVKEDRTGEEYEEWRQSRKKAHAERKKQLLKRKRNILLFDCCVMYSRLFVIHCRPLPRDHNKPEARSNQPKNAGGQR